MMTAQRLAKMVSKTFLAHAEKPAKPSKAVRKWDGKTPYGIHPVWCAMTLLAETTLPEKFRVTGALALLFHDVKEGTTAELPKGLLREVVRLVEGMTFESSDEEMLKIWSRSRKIKLLKLYDKVSNLLDGSWMSKEKRVRYAKYLLRLCRDVEPHYGKLNIIRIARAIC
ncbi:MAG: hypothetical protein Q8P07_04845 [bacterium]|nr:hypothetical protein [bacterium]